MKRYFFCWPFLLIPLHLLGCSPAIPPQVISISRTSLFKPKAPDEITNFNLALAAVITVATRELRLPVVDPISLHLYQDTVSFKAALSGPGGSDLARPTAKFAWGVGQPNRILINLEKTRDESGKNWVRFLAHEYTHTVQYSLAGSEQRISFWIWEGFADWVAIKVLHSLGWEDYGSFLLRAKDTLSRHKASLPYIVDLETHRNWLKLANQSDGMIKTYMLAFVAVDRLMEKKGVPGMIRYLTFQDFHGSFGLLLGEFQAELKRDL